MCDELWFLVFAFSEKDCIFTSSDEFIELFKVTIMSWILLLPLFLIIADVTAISNIYRSRWFYLTEKNILTVVIIFLPFAGLFVYYFLWYSKAERRKKVSEMNNRYLFRRNYIR